MNQGFWACEFRVGGEGSRRAEPQELQKQVFGHMK